MWSIILRPLEKVWSWITIAGLAALLYLFEKRRVRDKATQDEAAKACEKEIDSFIRQKQITDAKIKNAIEIHAKNAAVDPVGIIDRLRDKWQRD